MKRNRRWRNVGLERITKRIVTARIGYIVAVSPEAG